MWKQFNATTTNINNERIGKHSVATNLMKITYKIKQKSRWRIIAHVFSMRFTHIFLQTHTLPWKHGYNTNCQQDLRESYCFCIYFNYTTVNSIAIRTFNNAMSWCIIEAHFGERLKAITHGEQPFSFHCISSSSTTSRIHWWYGRLFYFLKHFIVLETIKIDFCSGEQKKRTSL